MHCSPKKITSAMLLADTNLPTVPRGSIRNVIERNTLEILGIDNKDTESPEDKKKDNKRT